MLVWFVWTLWIVLEGSRLIGAKPTVHEQEFVAANLSQAQRCQPEGPLDDRARPGLEHAIGVLNDLTREVGERWRHDGEPVPLGFSELNRSPQADDGEEHAQWRVAAAWALDQAAVRRVFDDLTILAQTRRLIWYQTGRRPGAADSPFLGPCRQLAMACVARMKSAVESNDGDNYCAAVEQGLALGRVVAQQGTLIDRLVAASAIGAVLDRIRQDVMLGRIPPDSWERLLGILDRQIVLPERATLVDDLRDGMRLEVAKSHTDDGQGDGWMLLSSPVPFMMDEWISRTIFEYEVFGESVLIEWPDDPPLYNVFGAGLARAAAETMKKAEWFFGRIGEMIRLLPVARAEAMTDLEDESHRLPRRHLFLRRYIPWVLPAFGKLLETDDQLLVKVSGVRAMLAVEAFRQRNRRLPDTLADLAPAFLREPPPDPYSGVALVYKLLPRDPNTYGHGYILYSVWEDGRDDGGKRAEGRWPQEHTTPSRRPGCDWIVNDEKDAGA